MRLHKHILLHLILKEGGGEWWREGVRESEGGRRGEGWKGEGWRGEG